MSQTIVNKCYIHDCHVAMCARCHHRMYSFEIGRPFGPEQLEANGMFVVCENCGGKCVTVPKVEPLCQCTKCYDRRYKAAQTGEQIREGFVCNRSGPRCH